MLRNFSNILGIAGFALAIAICLLATTGASGALELAAARHTTAICQAC